MRFGDAVVLARKIPVGELAVNGPGVKANAEPAIESQRPSANEVYA